MRSRSFLLRTLAVVATVAALAGCATPTPYQAAATSPYGYRTQQVGPDHYLITFTGNDVTPRETVEIYLLYRAAQVTLESGNDYFILVNKDTQRATNYWVSSDPFWGWPYGPWGYSPWGYDTTVTAVDQYKAFADVAVRKGPKPEHTANAYDARGVVASLKPVILRATREGRPPA